MNHLGQVFKELRTARKISLKEAAGEAFSYSMLSKFENGESDITISKLLVALENIRTELTEFVYLARGFQESSFSSFKNRFWKIQERQGLSGLQKMYQEELAAYEKSGEKEQLLHALVIKAQMLALDDKVVATEEELTFLYDYLFLVEIWGEYELKLFANLSPLLPLDLYFRYSREMLQKTDFLGDLRSNRNAIHTILLNGFLKAIFEKDLIKAVYFKKQIEGNFYQENDTYFRIVYRFAEGQYDCLRGERESGARKMQEAVEIFRTLGCEESADYYQASLEDFFKEFE